MKEELLRKFKKPFLLTKEDINLPEKLKEKLTLFEIYEFLDYCKKEQDSYNEEESFIIKIKNVLCLVFDTEDVKYYGLENMLGGCFIVDHGIKIDKDNFDELINKSTIKYKKQHLN